MQVAQNNMTHIFNNPSSLAIKQCCDLCPKTDYPTDMAPCPDGSGYYCTECLANGDVASYMRRVLKLTTEQINQYIKTLTLQQFKIKEHE